MQAIFMTAPGAMGRRQWVLDADLAGATSFDQIDHARLPDRIGTSPARE